jgi:predicted ATPase
MAPVVGRKKELADVLRLVGADGARLVTLTGPGGVGKTRMALELASELVEHFGDGVWFVDLSALRDSELVLPTVASTLGAEGDLADRIADRELLVVLDNFEQVVEAARGVAALLRTCPGLAVLVTSREPLHVAGEHEYPLRPLSEAPAVELFRQRARSAFPDFEADYAALADVCRRLDSLPLAIELAAARMRMLTADELFCRLERRLPLLRSRRRDAPERQRTLRAAIEWSYDLLAPELGAAERVAEADLDTLESLVEKSLLRNDLGRFTMLETIRELAAELLAASDEAVEIRERHAGYFRRMAQDADEEIEAAEQFTEEHPDEEWFDRLAADEDNLRAALRQFLGRRRCEDALRTCFAMRAFWLRRDRAPEGFRWTTEALGCLGHADPAARALGFYAHAALAFFTSNFDAAERSTHELLVFARDRRDERMLAAAYSGRGRLARSRGDLAGARSLMEEALEIERRVGDPGRLYFYLHQLGEIARDEGDYGSACSTRRRPRRVPRGLRTSSPTPRTAWATSRSTERTGTLRRLSTSKAWRCSRRRRPPQASPTAWRDSRASPPAAATSYAPVASGVRRSGSRTRSATGCSPSSASGTSVCSRTFVERRSTPPSSGAARCRSRTRSR